MAYNNREDATRNGAPEEAAIARRLSGVLTCCAQADARHVALVIGNSAYRNVSPLANSLNDARLVADALVESGFESSRLR